MPFVDPKKKAKWNRDWKKVRASQRKGTLKRLFGMTPEDAQSMFYSQGGLCAICSKHMCMCVQWGCKTLARIDHCHDSGAVRGMLCNECNMGLGKFKDSTSLLRKALAYLERICPTVLQQT